MSRQEFLEKAKETGYSQELIDRIVRDVEEDNIKLGLPPAWEMCLVELPNR